MQLLAVASQGLAIAGQIAEIVLDVAGLLLGRRILAAAGRTLAAGRALAAGRPSATLAGCLLVDDEPELACCPPLLGLLGLEFLP